VSATSAEQRTLSHPRRASPSLFWLALALCLTVVLVFLTLPVVAIFVHSSPGRLLSALGEPVAREALLLSLETTTIAIVVIVVLGTPAAYLLARRRLRGQALILTALELPLVLPPAVAGIGLLAALGPSGILGGALRDAHVALVLQTAGVVVALCFVASPFYIRQAHASFLTIERSLLEASADLGARERTTLLRVALPIAAPGLLVGLALAWGRALGEFGATLMFAGSFQGVTQTAPLAIYDQFATDLPAALALSAVLVVVSAVLLLSIKLLSGSPPALPAT
jgi:molybdate transport system permease protein